MTRLCIPLLLAASYLLAQQAGIVEVQVRNSLTSQPVSGATVKLQHGDIIIKAGISDAHGMFRARLESLADVRASVTASDYQQLRFLSPAPGVVSPADSTTPRVRFTADLVPLGQIAGRILSPEGPPMKGIPVGLRRPWDWQWTQTTVSGEDGRFRFPNLEPGTWILAALPTFRISLTNKANQPKPVAEPGQDQEPQRVGWAATFFPGVTDMASAAKIRVSPGAVLDGYNLKLRTLPLRSLSGRVLDDEGKPVAGAWVSASDIANKGTNGLMTTTKADGRFQFEAAKDGDWRLFAQATQPGGANLKGYADLHISRRDVEGVEVRLNAPFPVKGVVERVEPRDSEGNRKLTAIYLKPEGASADVQEGGFHEQDGSFVLRNVYPGKYRVLPAGYVPGFYVDAILYGEQDATRQPVDITGPALPLRIVYKSGAAWATGTVEKGDGAWVVLIPRDEAFRDVDQFIRIAKCDARGRFQVDNLRPGGYYAFAFNRVEREMLEDPDFVRLLEPLAVRAELRHGEATTLELALKSWPDY